MTMEIKSLYYGFGDGREEFLDDGSTKLKYYLTDHLGSVRVMLDENGMPVEVNRYSAYGEVESSYPNQLPSELEMASLVKFTGKEFDEDGEDSENGVAGIQAYYFGARYFDPNVGIWFSTDPVEQFWNLYSYTTNPLLYLDPDGMKVNKFWKIFWRVTGGLALDALSGGAISGTAIATGTGAIGIGLGAATTITDVGYTFSVSFGEGRNPSPSGEVK